MRVAFFDLDNTLVKGSSLYYLTKSLLLKGLINKREMAHFIAAQAKFLKSRTEDQKIRDYIIVKALQLVKGKHIEEIEQLINDEVAVPLNLAIYPKMKEKVRQHQAAGHETWIITASPTEIASFIAKQLDMAGALATKAEILNGRYTGALTGQVLHGSLKAKALFKFSEKFKVNLDETYAYSDSINDLPLLCSVGYPVAVNPNDELLRIANKNKWQVINTYSAKYKLKGQAA